MNTQIKNEINRWLRLILLVALAVWQLGERISAQPVLINTLHAFTGSPEGALPGSILLGTDQSLYGITYFGPLDPFAGRRTLFKMNRDGSGFQIIHNFPESESGLSDLPGLNGVSLIQGSDGQLYGYGGAKLFKCNADGGEFTVLHTNDTGLPFSITQGNDDILYGTDYFGTLFRMDTDGGNYAILTNLTMAVAGTPYPVGRLLHGSDGRLYGTAIGDGTANIVYAIQTNGEGFTVLHNFVDADDGSEPWSGLIQGADGTLYGTTRKGGSANDGGTIYKLKPDGSEYDVLHRFGTLEPADGRDCFAGLVQGPDGVLYGTTISGTGSFTNGTVFKIFSDGSGYHVLHAFTTDEGHSPYERFLVAGQFSGDIGVLYGTIGFGGLYNHGTVFSMVVNPPVLITPVATEASGNQMVVFWPTWASSYTLQTTTNLSSDDWTTISNGAPIVGVQLTNLTPQAYYRLIYR